MYSREDAIDAMCEEINMMNVQAGLANGLKMEEINQAVSQMQPELHRVNGILYDKLQSIGVIS